MSSTTKAFLLFTLLLWLVTCCRAQQKGISEEAFTAEINQWMAPYRQEQRGAVLQWMEAMRKDPASGRNHPIYKHMQAFYNKHRAVYRQLRLQSLQRYPSRPSSFPGYQPVDPGDFWQGDMNLDSVIALTQEMGNIRILNVVGTSAIQGMLSGPILSYLNKEKGRDLSEVSRLLGFGSVMLADKAGPDTWNIAYVNRCYILNYQWNIDNNQISGLSVLLHDGARQQPGWLQDLPFRAESPALLVSHKATALLWKLYDELLTEEDYHDEERLEEMLQQFINNHRGEYIQARAAALGAKPPCKDGWKARYVPVDSLRDHLRYVLEIPQDEQYSKLRPATSFLEFDCNNMFITFQGLVNREIGSNEGMAVSWLTGREVYARKLDNHRWEIQGFYQQYAITYTWNIATDAIGALQCWKKQ